MAPWQPGQPLELLGAGGSPWTLLGGEAATSPRSCCSTLLLDFVSPTPLLPTLPRLCPRALPGCGHQELVTEPLESRPQHLTRVSQRNEPWSPQCRAWGQDSIRIDRSLRFAMPMHPTLYFYIRNQRVPEQLFVELETIAVPFPAEMVGSIEMAHVHTTFPLVCKTCILINFVFLQDSHQIGNSFQMKW